MYILKSEAIEHTNALSCLQDTIRNDRRSTRAWLDSSASIIGENRCQQNESEAFNANDRRRHPSTRQRVGSAGYGVRPSKVAGRDIQSQHASILLRLATSTLDD